MKNELLVKYYKDGGKFLTMLPDGTAQLLYPLWAGSLALAQGCSCSLHSAAR